jgi:dienelactone hydrolase
MRKVFVVAFALIAQLCGCSTTSTTAVPYVFEPPIKGSYPGVIILHTSAGLYSHETDYAQILTQRGYVTAVVDYFAEGHADNITKAYEMLSKNPQVAGNRIGMVGFSRGAFTAINQMGTWGDSKPISAMVSYYIGPSLNMTDNNLTPILFLHGDEDNNVDADKILKFCATQKARGRVCEVEIYKHGRHAFDHPMARLGGYNEEITKQANIKAIEFLDRYLKNTK